MTQYTEEQLLIRRIEKGFHKGIETYGLIEDNDKLLIGLSGGKDSLALVELLGRQQCMHVPHIKVMAAHIVMENIPYSSNLAYLQSFTEQYGIPLTIYRTHFNPATDSRKSPCFLCSWNRRKALFTIAHELGCNKLVLGHHNDDILVTLLMNQVCQGTFSTMPPLLKMKKFDMTIIRPMCLIHGQDLKALAELHNYQKQIKNCPYEKESSRSAMEDILHQLEQLIPHARYNLWSSMSNIQEDLLPKKVNL